MEKEILPPVSVCAKELLISPSLDRGKERKFYEIYNFKFLFEYKKKLIKRKCYKYFSFPFFKMIQVMLPLKMV